MIEDVVAVAAVARKALKAGQGVCFNVYDPVWDADKRLALIPSGVWGEPNRTLLIAYEGSGSMFWDGEYPTQYDLMASGFHWDLAVEVYRLLAHIFAGRKKRLRKPRNGRKPKQIGTEVPLTEKANAKKKRTIPRVEKTRKSNNEEVTEAKTEIIRVEATEAEEEPRTHQQQKEVVIHDAEVISLPHGGEGHGRCGEAGRQAPEGAGCQTCERDRQPVPVPHEAGDDERDRVPR